MKPKIQIPQDILATIDYTNTVNGGMSEPIVKVNHIEKGYEIIVKCAGIEADSFQIDILKNRLWIYHLVNLFAERPEGLANMNTIRMLGNLYLPNDVDAESIEARYQEDGNQLVIFLPFNHKRNMHRHIDIQKS